ncbi:hypothetical protein K466DRAFT_603712 [Polyporus arcularius HHB13444]|uniref:Uncharacterized protein n=1 Tax=Polyporus arcularius HHB13444 TaxID=1314778 RepID=A0A5C3NYH0_9APHY|nr:hypothetical protein K466DRAFT_603712 [Polyporus arcularius HHB13444]
MKPTALLSLIILGVLTTAEGARVIASQAEAAEAENTASPAVSAAAERIAIVPAGDSWEGQDETCTPADHCSGGW